MKTVLYNKYNNNNNIWKFVCFLVFPSEQKATTCRFEQQNQTENTPNLVCVEAFFLSFFPKYKCCYFHRGMWKNIFLFFCGFSMLLLLTKCTIPHYTNTCVFRNIPYSMVLVYDIMCWVVHGKYVLFQEMEHFHSCRQIPKFQSIFRRTKMGIKYLQVNYHRNHPKNVQTQGTLIIYFMELIRNIPINLHFYTIIYSMMNLSTMKYILGCRVQLLCLCNKVQ